MRRFHQSESLPVTYDVIVWSHASLFRLSLKSADIGQPPIFEKKWTLHEYKKAA